MLRASAAALVGLATGGAIVLAHGGAEGRIHGCLDDQSRIRIVGPSECQSAGGFDWNIVPGEGEPGERGAQGPTGPTGAPGVPGRPGADSRMPVRTSVAASAWAGTDSRVVEAHCRRGEFAVGGGWRAEDPGGAGEFRPLESRPLDAGRGWRARVAGLYAYEPWRLVVTVACTTREPRP